MAPPSLSPKYPCFFQVILEECLQQDRLNIPKNFVRKHGDCIVSPVEIEDPTGVVLNVGLIESGGYIQLQDGWKEFAKRYSLELGQFVVFRSVGNGKFHVLVFELSGSEMKYPHLDGKFTEPKVEEGEEGIKVDILRGFPKCQEVRPKSPCFFQIILEDCLRKGKLRIPKKFARINGDGILRRVELEDPTGAVCKVGVTKREGKMWLQKGWRKFVKRYCIENRYVLVFRLEGNHKFHVLIFDLSATEIDYPSHSSKNSGDCSHDRRYQEPEVEEPANNISVETLQEISQCKKVTQKLPLHSQPRKAVSGTDEGCLPMDCEGVQVFQEMKEMDTLEKRNAEAIERAMAFKSGNPYVIVSLQPSHIRCRRLDLPNNFLDDHLNDYTGALTLQSMDGKTWPAKYCGNSFYSGWREFAQDNDLVAGDICVFELIKGAEGNSLKISINPIAEKSNFGLALVDKGKGKDKGKTIKQRCKGIQSTSRKLENSTKNENSDKFTEKHEGLTKDDGMETTLTQERRNADTVSLRLPSSKKSKAKALQRARSSKQPFLTWKALALQSAGSSIRPSFSCVMQTTYINGGSLTLGLKFAEKHIGDGQHENVLLCLPNGRTWNVRYASKAESSGRYKPKFHLGWRAFVKDNNLKKGDVCVFELIQEKPLSFNVTIISASAADKYIPSSSSLAIVTEANQGQSSKALVTRVESNPNDDDWELNLGKETTKEVFQVQPSEPLKAIANSTQEQPPEVTLRPYQVKHLCVPYYFRNNEKFTGQKTMDWKLRVEDRTWPMKLTFHNNRLRLAAGWSLFARENRLQAGDTCIFELDEENTATINVSISRRFN